MRKKISPDAHADLPPLILQAGRLADSVVAGCHRHRMAGVGDSFWQFRPYTNGEPTTGIDWRQSAKSQTLFVRERENQNARTCWLWRDQSSSMRYASKRGMVTKGERADVILLALAHLLTRGGERFGWYGPNPRRHSVATLTHHLRHAASNTACFPGHHPVAKGGFVVLIGDFFGPIQPIRDGVAWLSARGLTGCLIHSLDPAEYTLPFRGRIRFESMEDTKASFLAEKTQDLRDAYRDRLGEHQNVLRTTARQRGWHYMDHNTAHSPRKLLLALHDLMSRRQRWEH